MKPSPAAIDSGATLLSEVESFLLRTDMPATRFGVEALRDPCFVLDLRRGRSPTERVIQRTRHFMKGFER